MNNSIKNSCGKENLNFSNTVYHLDDKNYKRSSSDFQTERPNKIRKLTPPNVENTNSDTEALWKRIYMTELLFNHAVHFLVNSTSSPFFQRSFEDTRYHLNELLTTFDHMPLQQYGSLFVRNPLNNKDRNRELNVKTETVNLPEYKMFRLCIRKREGRLVSKDSGAAKLYRQVVCLEWGFNVTQQILIKAETITNSPLTSKISHNEYVFHKQLQELAQQSQMPFAFPKLFSYYYYHSNKNNLKTRAIMEDFKHGNLYDYACSRSIPFRLKFSAATEIARGNDNRLLRLFMSAATGLYFLHFNNIVHLDIKPKNVFLDLDTLRVGVLGDLGSANRLNNIKLSPQGIGTFKYNSPEIFRSCLALKLKNFTDTSSFDEQFIQSVGKPTDIYSLGITFYQTITGILPCSSYLYIYIDLYFSSIKDKPNIWNRSDSQIKNMPWVPSEHELIIIEVMSVLIKILNHCQGRQFSRIFSIKEINNESREFKASNEFTSIIIELLKSVTAYINQNQTFSNDFRTAIDGLNQSIIRKLTEMGKPFESSTQPTDDFVMEMIWHMLQPDPKYRININDVGMFLNRLFLHVYLPQAQQFMVQNVAV